MFLKHHRIGMFLLAAALWAGPTHAADAPMQAPFKVLLLPSEIKIFNITAGGGMDEAPDATAKMTAETDAELRRALATSPVFHIVELPPLSPDEQSVLKEHIALYKLAAEDAEKVDSLGGDWKHQLEHFEYTIGPGLSFLRQRSGADYALIVFGGDGESTGGRQAMNVLGAILGAGMVEGRNYLYAGLIELSTGKLTWLNYDTHNAKDFTSENNMDVFVDGLFSDYPDASLHAVDDQPSSDAPAGDGKAPR